MSTRENTTESRASGGYGLWSKGWGSGDACRVPVSGKGPWYRDPADGLPGINMLVADKGWLPAQRESSGAPVGSRVMKRSRRTGRVISARNRQLAAKGYITATRRLGEEVPEHILRIAQGD